MNALIIWSTASSGSSAPASGDALVRHGLVAGLLTGLLGDRVEEADVPAAVLLHGRQAQLRRRVSRLGGRRRALAAERLVDDDVAEREGLAVDGGLVRRGDVDGRDVGGRRRVGGDLGVGELDVEALDLARIGVVTEHVEALEVVDQVDHRLAEGLPLPRQEQVDGAEDVLVVERLDQLLAGLGGAGGTALVVVAADLGEGEHAGADEGDDGHGRADDDALRALLLRRRRGHLDRRGRLHRHRRRTDLWRAERLPLGRRRRLRRLELRWLELRSVVEVAHASTCLSWGVVAAPVARRATLTTLVGDRFAIPGTRGGTTPRLGVRDWPTLVPCASSWPVPAG